MECGEKCRHDCDIICIKRKVAQLQGLSMQISINISRLFALSILNLPYNFDTLKGRSGVGWWRFLDMIPAYKKGKGARL